jgi:hypothetical protein
LSFFPKNKKLNIPKSEHWWILHTRIEHIMADEQETKVPDTVEVGKKEDEETVSVVTEAATSVPPKEEEDGDEEPKTKDEEAVEAAESTATFEPVVS